MEDRKQGSKKKADKLTALLSLSVADEKPHTPCLTAQEMAELIDDPDGHENFSRFQHHLSSCDRCYQEWLCLKKIVSPPAKRGRIYQFPGTTKRKLAGTVLAIAASIAVFLNIPSHQDTIFKQQAPVQYIAPQKSPQASAHLQTKKAAKVENRFSLDAENTLQEYQAEESKAVGRQLPLENKKWLTQPASKMRQEPMMTGSADKPTPVIDEITKLDNWITKLELYCKSAPQTPSSWLTVKLEGEHLLQSQRSAVSNAKRMKILLLLQLLSEIDDEDSAVSQCRLIRSQLAEDE